VSAGRTRVLRPQDMPTERPTAREEVAPEGTMVTVSWGEEVFQPVQYNTFRCGGNSITTPTKPGETYLEAYRRAWLALEELSELQFNDKLAGYGKRLQRVKEG
jgi:hypothetical protein